MKVKKKKKIQGGIKMNLSQLKEQYIIDNLSSYKSLGKDEGYDVLELLRDNIDDRELAAVAYEDYNDASDDLAVTQVVEAWSPKENYAIRFTTKTQGDEVEECFIEMRGTMNHTDIIMVGDNAEDELGGLVRLVVVEEIDNMEYLEY